MNEEEARQLADALRENAEMMRNLGVTQVAMVDIMKQLAKAQGVNVKNVTDFDNALKNANQSVKQSEIYQKSAQQAAEKKAKADANYEAATNSAQRSVGSFAGAIMTTEKSLGKFGAGITAAGDAVWQLSKNFGLIGMAIGGLTKAATMGMDAALKQTDASLKATDDLSAMGTAGAFTAKEVLKMGHQAGLSSQNLEIFTKAAARANTGLSGFGNTVADGVKAFSQMTAVSKEQRMAFERMGISQEQLMAMQGDYIKLQEMSGISMKGQAQDAGRLKKESLEYVENLTRLSAMTGKSADKLAKEQEAQQMEYEELIQTRQEEDKIRELKAQGRDKEAESLKLEQQKRKAYLQEIEQVYGKDMALKAGRLSRTGSYDKSTASLAVLGIDPNRIQSDIKNAKDLDAVRRNAASFNQEVKGLQSESLKSFGTALQYRGEELGNKLGVSKESIATSSKYMDRNEVAAYEAAKKQTGKPSEGQTSDKTATDPAQVFRNEVTEAGIAVRKKFDEVILAMNPMMSGFNATTIAATALTAAAIAASAALSAMALKSGAGKLLEMGTNNATKGAGALSGAGKILSGAKGGIAGLVGGVALDYAGNKAEAAGHHKTAGALNVGSSALSGAGTGAMIGSVIPGVGTLIGGALGGALGGAYGLYKNWGRVSGEEDAMGRKVTDSGTPVAAAVETKQKEDREKKEQIDKENTKATKDLDVTNKDANKLLTLNNKALDDLRVAIEDLTTVATIKDATGTTEQKQRAMEAIYTRRGIGAPGAAASTSAVTGGAVGGAPQSSPSVAGSTGGAPQSRGIAGGPDAGHSDASGAGSRTAKLTRITSKSGVSTVVGDSYAPAFQGLIDYLDKSGYQISSLGGYVDRDVRGKPGVKSIHAHGAAIDINPQTNPMGPTLVTDMPQDISSVAKSLGLGWGGNWSSRKDAMHFSAAQSEGGSLLQAMYGGVFNGPTSGYDVELHGREAIVPLPNPNSKITVSDDAEKQDLASVMAGPSTSESNPMNDMMLSFMEEFREMMETKFDDMIDTMKENNSISDKILTYTKA